MFRKRLFVALTVIVMFISMVGVTAFADSDIDSDEEYYPTCSDSVYRFAQGYFLAFELPAICIK